MHKITRLHKRITATGILVLVLGICIGLLIKTDLSPKSKIRSVRENNTNFKFINPILFVDNPAEGGEKYKRLKSQINSYIKSVTLSKQATSVAVYFRDLNSSQWIGINEDDDYIPASMLKVALLITYLREAETDYSILDKKVRLSPDSFNLNSIQTYKPVDPILPGNTYKIKDLLLKMSIDSDNNAMALLTDAIATSTVTSLYKDLELPLGADGQVTHLSPALYSHFFRVLYNSSYMSRSLSEKILEVLSETDFSAGLQSGVPDGTTISHKFGERTITDDQGLPIERQLHDCGIVYFPENPYFLCVMTKGKDFKPLEAVISSISRITWDYVASSTYSK